jgi:hypothetical protein
MRTWVMTKSKGAGVAGGGGALSVGGAVNVGAGASVGGGVNVGGCVAVGGANVSRGGCAGSVGAAMGAGLRVAVGRSSKMDVGVGDGRVDVDMSLKSDVREGEGLGALVSAAGGCGVAVTKTTTGVAGTVFIVNRHAPATTNSMAITLKTISLGGRAVRSISHEYIIATRL